MTSSQIAECADRFHGELMKTTAAFLKREGLPCDYIEFLRNTSCDIDHLSREILIHAAGVTLDEELEAA